MPFEPLGTDEPADRKTVRPKAFEAQLMSGCLTVLVVCLAVYLAAFLPFLALPYLSIAQLITALAISAVPRFVIGIIAVRMTGLSGAVGFAGGTLGQAVFLFLRLESATALREVPLIETAEYPSSWQFLIPLVWLFAAATVLFFSWPDRTRPTS